MKTRLITCILAICLMCGFQYNMAYATGTHNGNVHLEVTGADYDEVSGELILHCDIGNYSSDKVAVSDIDISIPKGNTLTINMSGQVYWVGNGPDESQISIKGNTVHMTLYNLVPGDHYSFNIDCTSSVPEHTDEMEVNADIDIKLQLSDPADPEYQANASSQIPVILHLPAVETVPETTEAIATESEAEKVLKAYISEDKSESAGKNTGGVAGATVSLYKANMNSLDIPYPVGGDIYKIEYEPVYVKIQMVKVLFCVLISILMVAAYKLIRRHIRENKRKFDRTKLK